MNMKITHRLMFSFFIAFLMVSIYPLALATTSEEVFTAIQDARRDAGYDASAAIYDARRDAVADTKCIWYCFPLAYSVAAFKGNALPTPPTVRFVGKSHEYIDIYLREYHKAALNSRSQKLSIGSFVGSVVLVLLGLVNGTR